MKGCRSAAQLAQPDASGGRIMCIGGARHDLRYTRGCRAGESSSMSTFGEPGTGAATPSLAGVCNICNTLGAGAWTGGDGGAGADWSICITDLCAGAGVGGTLPADCETAAATPCKLVKRDSICDEADSIVEPGTIPPNDISPSTRRICVWSAMRLLSASCWAGEGRA